MKVTSKEFNKLFEIYLEVNGYGGLERVQSVILGLMHDAEIETYTLTANLKGSELLKALLKQNQILEEL